MTALLVLDASIAIAWLLEDEDAPDVFGTIEQRAAVVPQLWHLEIRNALLSAERRGRINPDQITERLTDLQTLPIHTDQEPDFDAAMQLALTHNLTFYDALYLELAIRNNAHLATLDTALTQAAEAVGVPSTP